ncbi:MAG: PASTA domain-containing protein [Microbacterium sp.]
MADELKHRPGRARQLLRIAIACCIVAAVCASVVIGWSIGVRTTASGQGYLPGDTETIALPQGGAANGAEMPDVRGLSEDDATQVIADAGISVSKISVSARPAAGAPGRVIEQVPAFGAVAPTIVAIVVAEPAEVPEDLIGMDAGAALMELQSLGARVRIERRYVAGVDAGVVASSDSKPGEPLPEAVTLVVGDTAVTRALSELDSPGSSGSGSEDYLFGGITYDTAVDLSAGWNDSTEYAWSLDGEAETIEGMIAAEEIPDRDEDDPAYGTHIVVRGDGEAIADYDIRTTDPVDFSWDVSGVETLTVVLEGIDDDGAVDVVLLEPTVLGSYEDLDEQ